MTEPGEPGPVVIESNMTMSIAAIFFFPPLAIPALLHASRVQRLLAAGDIDGALAASNASKRWSRWALIIGIPWCAFWAIVCCAVGGLAAIFG